MHKDLALNTIILIPELFPNINNIKSEFYILNLTLFKGFAATFQKQFWTLIF